MIFGILNDFSGISSAKVKWKIGAPIGFEQHGVYIVETLDPSVATVDLGCVAPSCGNGARRSSMGGVLVGAGWEAAIPDDVLIVGLSMTMWFS